MLQHLLKVCKLSVTPTLNSLWGFPLCGSLTNIIYFFIRCAITPKATEHFVQYRNYIQTTFTHKYIMTSSLIIHVGLLATFCTQWSYSPLLRRWLLLSQRSLILFIYLAYYMMLFLFFTIKSFLDCCMHHNMLNRILFKHKNFSRIFVYIFSCCMYPKLPK